MPTKLMQVTRPGIRRDGRLFGACLAGALVVLGSALPAHAWFYDGHRKIAVLGVEYTGTNLPAFFREGTALIQHCAGDPDAFKDLSPEDLRKAEHPEHFIDWEMLQGATPPRTRYEFLALCAEKHLDPAAVGTLPYSVSEWEQRLGVALTEYRHWPGNEEARTKALVYAGVLAHYAGDLVMPLHATIHYNGRVGADGRVGKKGIHHLVDALAGKTAFPSQEIFAGVPAPAPFEHVMDGILAELGASRQWIDKVYEMEPRLPKAEAPLGDDPQVRAFMLDRMRAGGTFLGRLYVTAWEQSAHVRIPDFHDRTDADAVRPPRVGAAAAPATAPATASASAPARARNVILMVADGAAMSHYTLARWYKGGPLALDAILTGAVRTYSADSLITDSAPAATAFATGHKTDDKFIGMSPDEALSPGVSLPSQVAPLTPLATVLEGALLTGKSAGLVVTVNAWDATPAGFSAHWRERSGYDAIVEQQVNLGMQVVLGGGRQYLLPASAGGLRTDNKDLFQTLRDTGYAVVTNAQEMAAAKGPRLWGAFADGDMACDFDRRILATNQPSLAAMSRKAIEVLDGNTNGFFLMIEGSKVDREAHANDPVGIVSEVLAFDEAVQVALEFARRDGQTLVMAFSDHATGGMSLGSSRTDFTYPATPLDALASPLRKARLTGEGVEEVLGSDFTDDRKIREAMREYYGVDDLSDQEMVAIREADGGRLNYVVGGIISRRSIVGWTTHGHTGEDVPLFAFGPGHLSGLVENTDIARSSATGMGFDLDAVQSRLFAPAEDVFAGDALRIDRTAPGGPALALTHGGHAVSLLFNRKVMMVDGKPYPVEGLTVLSPRRTLTVPYQGRLYVLGTCASIEAVLSGAPPQPLYSVSRIRGGPAGETVVFEADAKSPAMARDLMRLYGSLPCAWDRDRVFVSPQAGRILHDLDGVAPAPVPSRVNAAQP